MLYTALITPFEVAFIAAPTSIANPWFIVNRLIDVVFCCDMVLQFYVAFEHVDSHNAAYGHGVFHTQELVWDRKRIAKHYLLGLFSIDLLSILPSFLDMLPMLMATGGEVGGANYSSKVRILRVLRALRLIKLARLLRAQRVIARWSTRISVPQQQLIMLACLFVVLLLAHWYACIFALQASIHNSPSDTWLGVYGYCEPTIGGNASRNMGALEVECPAISLGEWYLAAYALAIMVLTGTGGTVRVSLSNARAVAAGAGTPLDPLQSENVPVPSTYKREQDAYPSAASTAETAVVVVLVLTGALMWTQVLCGRKCRHLLVRHEHLSACT